MFEEDDFSDLGDLPVYIRELDMSLRTITCDMAVIDPPAVRMNLTEAEAQKAVDLFNQRYPEIKRLHDRLVERRMLDAVDAGFTFTPYVPLDVQEVPHE